MLEFALELREECSDASYIVDVLPRICEDLETLERRKKHQYQRGIAAFVAAGGVLHQLGDQIYAALDGHEEGLRVVTGDDRLRRWWQVVFMWAVRYSRARGLKE